MPNKPELWEPKKAWRQLRHNCVISVIWPNRYFANISSELNIFAYSIRHLQIFSFAGILKYVNFKFKALLSTGFSFKLLRRGPIFPEWWAEHQNLKTLSDWISNATSRNYDFSPESLRWWLRGYRDSRVTRGIVYVISFNYPSWYMTPDCSSEWRRNFRILKLLNGM